uniref:Zinc finger BED domain-containing protein 5 n=1 Tax=Cacopsylla melanoneura TaxID=428564 RepID=A0A8D8UL86_9HEMI
MCLRIPKDVTSLRVPDMFHKLSKIKEIEPDDEDEDLNMPVETIEHLIIEHLKLLQKEVSSYFSDCNTINLAPIRNPFSVAINVAEIAEILQDEFIEMKNNSFSKDKFLQKSLIEFWCSVRETYPNLANMALKILVPFVSTYLCEAGFSTLVNIKTKSRNKLPCCET